ncbi:4'-phosphopantetheinyl transferase [Streptomyces sp. NPDC005374]|uniref:4'-phosphopantetheinyl transferase family protein n=1 Tax=Streptomyces sp. NPDC005374 TaxID=3364713 RepID=UPI0036777787
MSATLLAGLLPRDAETAEAFEDPPAVFLFPEEQAVIANAADKRRREFATVRYCARRALTALGRTAEPLVPGQRRAPTWPQGIVGSMTHCDGYRAAAVARSADIASLGIDAEPHAPLPDGVLDVVALPREQYWVAELTRHAPSVHWDRLLFSAKESVYKTWFPLTGELLGFKEAELEIDPQGGGFRASLLREGRDREGRQLSAFDGRWQVIRGLVMTAVAYRP